MSESFEHLKVGDEVYRYLGGKLPMLMTVVEVRDDVVVCTAKGSNIPKEEAWTFDRKTGAEEDDYLKWGVKYGVTGSFLSSSKPS